MSRAGGPTVGALTAAGWWADSRL